jgi:hypothetical protein
MRIAFGWYSFKIKSFSAQDLQMDKEEWGNATFEVRQKVFHIFWLPFLSLGKSYAMRKGGRLYELPESVFPLIKAKGIRTPWYSFLLPVLLVAGVIGFVIVLYVGESLMRHKSYARDKEQYETAINEVQKQLSVLPMNAYLRIINRNSQPYDKALYLKVIQIKGNTYSFQLVETKIPLYSNEKYYLHLSKPDTLTFTKRELQSAICNNYDDFKERKSCGFNFLGGSDKYVIDDIGYFDEPVIDGGADRDFWKTIRSHNFHSSERFTGYKYDRSWNITFDLQNFGTPANLVQIKNIKGDLKWTDSLPMHFNRYEYLKRETIKGSTLNDPEKLKLKSILTFQDSLNRKYEFILEANASVYTIRRRR